METTPVTAKHYTVDDYLSLPDDGQHFQLVEGELLVNPAPILRHQDASRNLLVALHLFVTENRLGIMYDAPVGVRLAQDTVLEPDLVFVSADRRKILGEKLIEGAPDLVVEIISPSTRKLDQVRKREIYGRHNVLEYWIVDPEVERVEIYVLEGATLVLKEVVEKGELRSLAVLLGFAMPLADVFAH